MDEKEKLDQQLANDKEVAYYTALLSAWLESRNEVDKSIRSYSILAMGGLLATLLSDTHGEIIVSKSIVLFMFCMFSFFLAALLTFVSTLFNSKYIEDLNDGKLEESKLLAFCDIHSKLAFFTGIILSFILIVCIVKIKFSGA